MKGLPLGNFWGLTSQELVSIWKIYEEVSNSIINSKSETFSKSVTFKYEKCFSFILMHND